MPLGRDRIIADPMEIVRRAPDLIFGSWCGKKFRPGARRGAPGLGGVPAVRDGELHEIKSALILQPGPAALTDGLAAMHALIRRWAERTLNSGHQPVLCLAVLLRGQADDIGRQFRGRRLLVPAQGLEVVAHVLLVE